MGQSITLITFTGQLLQAKTMKIYVNVNIVGWMLNVSASPTLVAVNKGYNYTGYVRSH